MEGDTLTIISTIIGTVVAVGLALAGLIMRSTARLDADRREAQQRFDSGMADFRRELRRIDERYAADMRELAVRQAHVEGRLDAPGAAAD